MFEKILWVDTETTGTDPVRHGIIQASFIVEISGTVVVKQQFRMCPIPGKEFDPGALAVHGITEEEIRSYPPAKEVKPQICKFLGSYVNRYDRKDKFLVGGYCVDFDIRFLNQLWLECGDQYFFSYVQGRTYLDPILMIAFLQWSGLVPALPNNELGTIAKHFNVLDGSLHDAEADIRMARSVAYAMRELMLKKEGVQL